MSRPCVGSRAGHANFDHTMLQLIRNLGNVMCVLWLFLLRLISILIYAQGVPNLRHATPVLTVNTASLLSL